MSYFREAHYKGYDLTDIDELRYLVGITEDPVLEQELARAEEAELRRLAEDDADVGV